MTDSPPSPSKLIRAMRKNGAAPMCGARGNMLGVRPGVDIVADTDGLVIGGAGGLSVTPDDVRRMPPHVRPAKAGGRGRLPVYEIAVAALGAALVFRSDPAHPRTHGFVEPRRPMPLDDYQQALCATAASWSEIA